MLARREPIVMIPKGGVAMIRFLSWLSAHLLDWSWHSLLVAAHGAHSGRLVVYTFRWTDGI